MPASVGRAATASSAAARATALLTPEATPAWRMGAAASTVAVRGATVAASVAGPPVALWAANAGWSAVVQRATLQAYFLGVNVVALPSLGVPEVGARTVLLCLGALAAGVALGAPLARRLPEAVAARATLLLAGTGGAVVLGQALLG